MPINARALSASTILPTPAPSFPQRWTELWKGPGVSCRGVDGAEYWLWQYTDEFGKRRVTRWRMSAEDAKRLKDAVRVDGTKETRKPLGSTSDFLRSLPTYGQPGRTTNAPGSSSDTDTSKD